MIPSTITNQKGTICARNILISLIPFTIKTKKEQAINLRYKYFSFYDPFYYNKKEQAINLC